MTLDELRHANIRRNLLWDSGDKITPSFRGNEFGGESGEVQNQVKKLEREALGLPGSRTTVEKLASEMGDTLITLDLLAMEYDIDLGEATKQAFNKKSKEMSFDVFIGE